mmetsp:Transcript_17319/g.39218  ORF Transcript_17319/g.39218 Transcript_17319/m.39218 type:complete len:231 (+) Transcript_17319:56-748(+)
MAGLPRLRVLWFCLAAFALVPYGPASGLRPWELRCSTMPGNLAPAASRLPRYAVAESARQPRSGRSAPAPPAGASGRRQAVAAAVVAAVLLGGGAAWAKPPRPVVAQDKRFREVDVSSWVKATKGQPDLVLGLRGDPYWLLPGKDGGAIRNFALKAECTHLGCLAPWDSRQQKFVCPCHGSEYDELGGVLRGPAPHNLALAHVSLIEGEKVQLSAWTEEDFRNGEQPWWS